MRIMIRTFSLALIGLITAVSIMNVCEMNIRYDEMEKITSLAMANTQLVIMEKIEDAYYHTDNCRRKDIQNNDDYLSFFEENLDKLRSTDSSYTILDHKEDLSKGLLYVDVCCSYKTLLGNTKTFQKKMCNIIDVLC